MDPPTLPSKSQQKLAGKDGVRPTELPPRPSSGAAIYETAKSAIALSRDLFSDYDRVCKLVASKDRPHTSSTSQKENREVLQRLLSKHGDKAKLEVRHLLHGNDKVSEENAVAADDPVWSRFAKTSASDIPKESGIKGQIWASIAKDAQRGVHRMVKNLPEDSD